MEQLKSMKEMLTSQVHAQLANIEKADYHELGAAIDMIKDMAETEYYCSVVKAMEEAEEKQEQRGTERYYYTERYMPIPYQRVYDRDIDREYGKMYYNGNGGGGNQGGNSGSQGGSSGNQGGGNAGGGSSGGSGYSERGGGRYENPRYTGGNDRGRYFYEPPYITMPPMYDQRSSMMLRDPREGRSADRRRMYMESKEMHQGKEKQMQELESYMTELSGDITDMIQGASPEERQMLQKKLSALVSKIDQV